MLYNLRLINLKIWKENKYEKEKNYNLRLKIYTILFPITSFIFLVLSIIYLVKHRDKWDVILGIVSLLGSIVTLILTPLAFKVKKELLEKLKEED